MENNKKIAVVKFLKSAAYQTLIQKYNASYDVDKAYFEAKYE